MLRSLLRRNGLTIPQTDLNVISNEMIEDNDVNLSNSWSSVSCITNDLSRRFEKSVSVEDEERGFDEKPSLLLSIFKEVQIPSELIPPIGASNTSSKQPLPSFRPGEPVLAPRTIRLQSENTLRNVVSEQLKQICELAEGIGEPESEHSGRSSVVERHSPSTGEIQRRPQLTSQPPSPASERFRNGQLGGLSQPSPLDIVKQRLAPQTSADVFEFDPLRMTPTSGFENSSQFHFPGGAQSPYAFNGVQATRGLPGNSLKRRRGRKATNMGDRTGEQINTTVDPLTGLISSSGAARRPRGTGTARRPRRPRKAAQLAASQTHTHQFSGTLDRPVLQRSYSEMQYSTQSPQAASLSSVNRMNTISGGEGLDGSSDEEMTSSPSTQPLPYNNLSVPTTSAQSSNNNSNSLPFPSLSQFMKLSAAAGSSHSSMKSSAGSTGSNTPVPASPSSSITPAPAVVVVPKPEPAILKSRKSPKTLEAVVGKLHNKSSPSVTSSFNPYTKSDLYDDEAESPARVDLPVKVEAMPKVEVNLKSEVHHTKRESPTTVAASSSSPLARSQPVNDSQPQSDLKIILKVKQQAPSRSSTPAQYTSNISPPPSRLIGQPPSSTRCKEEKALARQKQQAREKAKREEEKRKALKRDRKEKLESATSTKRQKVEKQQEKKPTVVTEFPSTLNFASLKNFKIPKVIENEKTDSSQQPNNPAPTTSAAPASSSSSVAQSTSSTMQQPQPHPHPPKHAKSILKGLNEQVPVPFRAGIPQLFPATGRRPLLPYPDHKPNYNPRQMSNLQYARHLQGGVPPQPPSSSAGRWMALAPQKQNTSKNVNLEQTSIATDRGSDYSRAADSPTEGLKIVADDD